MDLKVLERKKEKLVVEVVGESHTLMNLLRENAWKAGAKQATYTIEHPYLSEPRIIVTSNNPKKTLADASQIVVDNAREFGRAFKRATKR